MTINKSIVYNTIYISLAIQFITTIISLNGFFIKLDDYDDILKKILGIEVIVQLIEAFFYIWIILALNDMKNMTPRRYIDWSITTPIMLLSTIIFMEFKYNRENDLEKITLTNFITNHKYNIIKIFIFNGFMLLFGYLAETGIIPKYIGISIGFIFFYLSFKLIYTEYAYKTETGKKLFYFICSIWSLYGIASMLNIEYKNISYNILDVISKNFYGLYIYYKILQYKKLN